MQHHSLDIYPIPREKTPLYINEPWLIDRTIYDVFNPKLTGNPEEREDNIRVYVPLDINRDAIFRRLDRIIYQYGEVSKSNELEFSSQVEQLISQIEIYNQIWFVRHMSGAAGCISQEGKTLVQEFIQRLEEIPDGGAECFPFEMIAQLREEYLDERVVNSYIGERKDI